MIQIVLMEPEHPGNIGAVARVMKNFGFRDLVLINPKVPINDDAKRRAKHSQDILKRAKIVDSSYLDSLDILIGTTARLGTDYNIPRSPLTPKDLARVNTKKKVGLLLGREGIGLRNEEISRCDFVITIPATKRYPTLNVSHALAVILYELFQCKAKIKSNSHIIPASKKDKEVLLRYINHTLDKMEFSTMEKRETQRIVWKRLVGKSMLTKREAFALMGFFRKLS